MRIRASVLDESTGSGGNRGEERETRGDGRRDFDVKTRLRLTMVCVPMS